VTTPTPSEKKVEQFAKKLRDEMEAQERVLNIYITTIQKKHAAVEKNLKRVRGVLSGLRNEIANATKYVAQYQGEERTQTTESNLVSGEYTKSRKMYEDEKQNLKFEKEFLDAILRYIKLRKSHKC
jgi:septal ring factor EnvC (AmiA/AmiB activator)